MDKVLEQVSILLIICWSMVFSSNLSAGVQERSASNRLKSIKFHKSTNLRTEHREVSLARGPAVQVVEGAGLLDHVACHVVQVSVVLCLLQHLPRLLLEEPHLLSNHLQLVADVGVHEGVSLRLSHFLHCVATRPCDPVRTFCISSAMATRSILSTLLVRYGFTSWWPPGALSASTNCTGKVYKTFMLLASLRLFGYIFPGQSSSALQYAMDRRCH
ncbi:hypothetical protein E2C01_033798 [Portunus trituberculatus]|uniref:Secreted protein n=1 Tax=Portunus trituberculatus TaxID=210409 RepID=A0A5B7F555_PORTR|nr:hypothetical protein [Portunus trituberculatus]